jgi:hypothetical protein
MIEVYECGSELAIKSGQTGLVEKIVIGVNNAVSYQLVCYTPERHPQVVSAFEVTPLEGKVTKRHVGFASVIVPEKKEVGILVDEDNRLVDIHSPDEVLVGVQTLDADELQAYNDMKEKVDGEAEEVQEEEKE